MHVKEKEEKYLKAKEEGLNKDADSEKHDEDYFEKYKEAYLKRICPFIKNPPSEECYCVKMDSQSIISIIKYCANNYSGCYIYQEHLKNLPP